MPRTRSRRRARGLKTVRYSNETTSIATPLPASQAGKSLVFANLVKGIDQQGIRKVKNFTLRVTHGCPTPLFFALVYVPAGQTAAGLKFGTYTPEGGAVPASLYEPNQNVIMCGTIDTGSATYPTQASTFRTRLARNLNSGDSIALVLGQGFSPSGENSPFNFALTLNYAICF